MNIYLLSGIFLFTIYNNILRKIFNTLEFFTSETLTEKLLENVFVSGTHCYLCVYNLGQFLLFDDINYYDNAVTISTAYYIYDLIRILNNYNYTLYDNTYIIHHIVSFGVIQYNVAHYSYAFFILGEISNIFYYPVYYSKKIDIGDNIKKTLHILQFVSYVICRVGLISYYYFISLPVENISTIIFGTPIVLMGWIWSYQLFLKIKYLK